MERSERIELKLSMLARDSLRRQFLTALDNVRPAFRYGLHDLQPLAMGIYTSFGATTWGTLDLYAKLSSVAPTSAESIIPTKRGKLLLSVHRRLSILFAGFRDPPAWFKEAVVYSLYVGYRAPDEFLVMPTTVRWREAQVRDWHFLEPNGDLDDADYVSRQVTSFKEHLASVLTETAPRFGQPSTVLFTERHEEHLETSEDMEPAALYVSGTPLAEIANVASALTAVTAHVRKVLNSIGWPVAHEIDPEI